MASTDIEDPLFVTCATGNEAAVEKPIQAGARAGAVDFLGWRAMDHAAYRGNCGS